MNNETCYLIHEDDYLKHIEDKTALYSMLCQLAYSVRALPDCPFTQQVKKLADAYDISADEHFKSWGIPRSYHKTGDVDDLSELMDNELIEPEDAGYYTGDDGDVFEYDDDYDEPDVAELLRVSKELSGVSAHLLECIGDMMPE